MRPWPAVALVLVAGCSDKAADPARFYPPPDRAQAALETALTGWQNGSSYGAVPGATDPVVQFIDARHAQGQKLTGYTILGLAPGDGPRVYTVKLTLSGASESVRTRYVVFGVDPVWVMRHEEYDQMAHWDHPMPKDAPAKSAGR